MSAASLSLSSESDSWYSLWNATSEYLDEPLSPEFGKLGSLLFVDEFQHHLRKPLDFAGPSSGSRGQVEQRCNDTNKVDVLRLSDDLVLDELVAYELYQHVSKKSVILQLGEATGSASTNPSNTSPFLGAVELFYFQRNCLLQVLAALMRVRNPTCDLCPEKQSLVLEATDRLLTENTSSSGTLVTRLISLITSHNKRLAQLLSPQCRGMANLDVHVAAIQKERRTMCETLFHLFYHTQALESEVISMIQLCQDMSTQWMEMPQDYRTGIAGSSSSLQAVYLLLMAVSCSLDRCHPLYDRTQSRMTGQLLPDNALATNMNWIKSINAMLAPASSTSVDQKLHDGVTGVLLLQWGLFLSKESDNSTAVESRGFRVNVLQSAFQRRALAFLRGLVHCPEIAHDTCREQIITVIDETVVNLITLLASDGSSELNSRQVNDAELLDNGDLLRPRAQLLDEIRLLEQQFNSNRPHARNEYGFNAYQDPKRRGAEVNTSFESDPLPDTLEDLLNLIAALCRLEPQVATKFWAGDRDVSSQQHQFIQDDGDSNSPLRFVKSFVRDIQARVTASNDPHSLYVSFLDMLAALGGNGDPECAYKLYHFLKTSTGDVCMDQLVGALGYYTSLLSKANENNASYGNGIPASHNIQPQQTYETIPQRDQAVVATWLRVLRAAAHSPRVAEDVIVGQGQSMGLGTATRMNGSVDDHLIALAQSDLCVFLKAEIFRTLAAFVHSDVVAQQIWTKLDQAGGAQLQHNLYNNASTAIVPQQQSNVKGVSACGMVAFVRMTLENKETIDKEYSVSRAFQELIWKLLHFSNSVPTSVKWSKLSMAPVDLQPYLDFAINDVFLRRTQRGYVRPEEHWSLAAGTLRILVEVLQRYDVALDFAQRHNPENQSTGVRDSAGFWLMSQILCGGQLFKRIVELLVTTGGVDGMESATELQLVNDIHSSQTASTRTPCIAWFVVAGQRANLDSKLVGKENLLSGPPQSTAGFGLLRPRVRPVASNRAQESSDDKGMFANWLVNSQTGLSQVLRTDENTSGSDWGQNSGSRSTKQTTWNNGDAGGLMKEQVVKLVLRLFDAVVAREDQFINLVRTTNARISDRLERIHRLFLGYQQIMTALTSLVRYKRSSDIQLMSTRILYRIAQHSPAGALANVLTSSVVTSSGFSVEQEVVRSFKVALSSADTSASTFEDTSDNETVPKPKRMSADDIWDDMDDLSCEVDAKGKVSAAILELLLSTVSHPQPNLAHLLLGLNQHSTRIRLGPVPTGVTSETTSLPMNGCLPTLLNLVDVNLHCRSLSSQLCEQIYKLLVILCKPSGLLGEELLYALRTQRNNFWLRHLEAWILHNLSGTPSASQNHALSWVLQGVTCDLERSTCGKYANKSAVVAILDSLFVTSEGNVDSAGEMDQTKARFIELLDSIPFEWTELEAPVEIRNAVNRVDSLDGPNGEEQQSCLEALETYHGHQFFQFDIARLHWVLRVGGEDVTNKPETRTRSGPATAKKADSQTLAVAGNKQNNSADDSIKQHLNWALEWNKEQRMQASRAHLVHSWKHIMEISLLSCGEVLSTQVNSAHGAGRNLYFEIVCSLVNKLTLHPDARAYLYEPVAVLVLDLTARLRSEDSSVLEAATMGLAWPSSSVDGTVDQSFAFAGAANGNQFNGTVTKAQGNREAQMAATGAYVSGFRAPTVSNVGSPACGLAHLSTQEYSRLFVGVLDAILKRSAATPGISTAPGSFALIRSSLYGALLQLLLATRELFAATLSGLAKTTNTRNKESLNSRTGKNKATPFNGGKNQRANSDTCISSRPSEIAFLQSTGGFSVTRSGRGSSNPWHGNEGALELVDGQNALGTNQQSPLIHKLRDRALLTLEALEGGNRALLLLEMLSRDLSQPDQHGLRGVSLLLIDSVLPCDRHGKWLGYLQRKRLIQHFAEFCVRHILRNNSHNNSTTGDAQNQVPSYDDTVYTCSMSVLSRVAQTKSGALAIVDTGMLAEVCAHGMVPILCDKRSRGSQQFQHSDSLGNSDEGTGKHASLQEIRHVTVLPLLRLVVGLLTTLSMSGGSHGKFPKRSQIEGNGGDWGRGATHPKLAQQVLEFLQTQHQFVVSCLGFPATSLADLEEVTLVSSILAQCAKSPILFGTTLGNLAGEYDSLMFNCLRELCITGSVAPLQSRPHVRRRVRQWDEVVPVSEEEVTRAETDVAAPPDLYFGHPAGAAGGGSPITTLFELDKCALELKLLRSIVVYCRIRCLRKSSLALEQAVDGKSHSSATGIKQGLASQSDFSGHLVCIDAVCNAIVSLLSSSKKIGGMSGFEGIGKGLKSSSGLAGTSYSGFSGFTLRGGGKSIATEQQVSEAGFEWFESSQYRDYQLNSLIFVLENSLLSVFALAKSVVKSGGEKGKQQVAELLKHKQLLSHYYGQSHGMSPLETVESKLRQFSDNSFTQTVIRKLRDLYHR